jgi:hypothetical protein
MNKENAVMGGNIFSIEKISFQPPLNIYEFELRLRFREHIQYSVCRDH